MSLLTAMCCYLDSMFEKKNHPQPLHEVVEGSYSVCAMIPLPDFREGLGVGPFVSLEA